MKLKIPRGHVRLLPPPHSGRTGGVNSSPLATALPFVRSRQGTYVHRVRSASLHTWTGGMFLPHTSFNLWCGNTVHTGGGKVGHPHGEAELFATPPARAVLCATCEGRAVGAGLAGPVRRIGGRLVLYRPRV